MAEKLQHEFSKGVSTDDIGSIVHAACLAHDIGNPPFGHAGEFAIQQWFRDNGKMTAELDDHARADLENYEGNAQGFRIVSQIENHLFEGGMRLTFATLGALLKYPWFADSGNPKFSCFKSEKDILSEVHTALGIPHSTRHPLAYLVEAADDICYAIIDLEDAVELGILRLEDCHNVFRNLGVDDKLFDTCCSGASFRRGLARLRGPAVQFIVDAVVNTFVDNESSIFDGSFGAKNLIEESSREVSLGVKLAKKLAEEKVFPAHRKTSLEVGSYATIGILLDAFCTAARNLHDAGGDIESVPFRCQRTLQLLDLDLHEEAESLYEKYMRVLDFVTGMTDNFSTYLAGQLRGAGGLSTHHAG